MISLHATKPLPAGEGAILIGPSDWIRRALVWSNFGFDGRRFADAPGTNAKLSEYHCAVALASLDRWPDRVVTQRRLVERASQVTASLGMQTAPGMARGFVSNTWIIQFADISVVPTISQLLRGRGIDTRTWWPAGLHEMAAFCSLDHDNMAVTKRLVATTLGLPFGSHLREDDYSKIMEVLATGLRT